MRGRRRRGAVTLAAAVAAATLALAGASPAAAGGAPRAGTTAGLSLTASGGDWTQGGPLLASRGTVVSYPSGRPDKAGRLPPVKASAFVLANAGTGQVLAARDAHGWFRPASTLKVLAAITFIPLLHPGATTVASHQAATTEPNDAGLVAGRSYAISSLFTALLTVSANDAAVALAQATGSFSQGIALMNAEARELQADDTVAVEPNGLDAPGQHISAYDEVLIARRALAMPAFLRYDETRAARFEVKPRHWVTLVNQNLMLTRYPGDIGGKIGWTSAAGATFVGMARRNGVTLIVSLLHCPPLSEFTYATRLLNWGFAQNVKVSPVGTLVSPLPPPAKKDAAAGHTEKARTAAARSGRAKRPGTGAAVGGVIMLAAMAGIGMALRRWHATSLRRRNAADQRAGPASGPPGPDEPGQPG